MRVPARFAALVGTGLILLSAYGARRLLRVARTRARRRRSLWGAYRSGRRRLEMRSQPYRLSRIPRPFLRSTAAVTSDMVLAELPMEDLPNFSYMYFSTFHWARLFNGQSGYFPAGYTALVEEMKSFPERGPARAPEGSRCDSPHRQLRLVLTAMAVPDAARAHRRNAGTGADLQGKWQGADVRLYKIASVPAR